jgi:phenylpropionate dioxygenase-like ring-hydroxylating dioxygenase large terminal subunit
MSAISPSAAATKVVEIPTFDTSLIVVRGNDGVVCSFHNICRHRGNKLVRAGEGCRASFVCGAGAPPARARVRCCAQRATGAVSPGVDHEVERGEAGPMHTMADEDDVE